MILNLKYSKSIVELSRQSTVLQLYFPLGSIVSLQAFLGGDLSSEFEFDSEEDKKKTNRHDLASKQHKRCTGLPSKREVAHEYDREEGRNQRFHILGLDAYSRHKKFVNDYMLYYGGSKADFKRSTVNDKTDLDVIRDNHRFLWSDEAADSWAQQLSKKYWDKLFKEYTISDLSRYKENKVALRWRVEKEVVDGKGQFSCGNKKCTEEEGLRTWEVNFGYIEHGEKKNALVKLRLCPDCSYKLNYHHRRKDVTKQVKKIKEKTSHKRKHKHKSHKKKKRRKKESSDSESGSDSEASSHPSTSKDTTDVSEKEAWGGPVKFTEEKSREEEFADYFEDMFL
ncbi:protein FRA10AC1-like [Saccoglossus kowalevskii]|uniref:Protein FRA10AC1-like n=1 Tax=Saccoglossus kowalevskii TaxID=10224 RepID=A0ABM0GNM2_SACKO|nr:PREDICTED: protein FRA10AC1-like [Saccoglossus kowalevskii]